MTTKELLQIVIQAEKVYEDSWDEKSHHHTLSMDEALEKVCPSLPMGEHELAAFLMRHAWNDAQDWSAMLTLLA